MSFNINAAYNYINDVIKLNPTLTDGMDKLLDYCRELYGGYSWNLMEHLDFEKDRLEIEHWLQNILEDKPSQEKVDIFWFGIFEGIIDDRETYIFYFSGINSDNSDDDTELVECEPVYTPSDGYFDSEILHNIYTHLKNEGGKVIEIGEYVLCLGYVSLLISSVIHTLDLNLLLNFPNPIKIMVGFDSGDYIHLNTINNIANQG